ncbi:hypothetical protein COCON_G00092360 [Conger conger]|uniref:Uncharacterized protein n=1 Tax=Conger conger TaxID=82655 RepID=A0A9Q1I0A1_CONCO|nr:hypothetical protein COCON_G00092360 [Conger conger]
MPAGMVKTNINGITVIITIIKWTGKDYIVIYFEILKLFMFSSYTNKKLTFFSISLHELSLRCQYRCHHRSYPGTLLFKKIHICIFISKYLLFKMIC